MKTPDQNFKTEPDDEKFIEFKTGAEKLHGLTVRLSGIIELGEDIKAIQSRTRLETAAVLLKELPDAHDEKIIEFRKKVLFECSQGISAFEPKDEQDRAVKEEIIEVINQLETFEN